MQNDHENLYTEDNHSEFTNQTIEDNEGVDQVRLNEIERAQFSFSSSSSYIEETLDDSERSYIEESVTEDDDETIEN